MDAANTSLPQRQLEVLEGLLRAPAGDLKSVLIHVADVIAAATGSDKIDAFLYDASRDSLVAVGTSNQPLSALQRKLGLNVLPISNDGRTVEVFRTGKVYLHGQVDEDKVELPGIREALGVRSQLGVPLEIGGARRGVLLCVSQKPNYFSVEDARMVETVGRWVGIVAHRAELVEVISRNAAEQGRLAGAEELVTVLAHDLRNYLGPLGFRIEALRQRALKEKRTGELGEIEAVFTSLGRLERLVGDVIDVARMGRGMFDLSPERVELGRMAEGVAAVFTTAPRPVFVSRQESEIAVSGDPARLRQCLDNIVANAVQKSPANARVTILVEREKQANGQVWARVEVADEGPGIPSEILPHVFDRFVTDRRSGGGLGLGLYMAKRIAAAHGGDLTAPSEPGKGARFTLTLPALESDAIQPGAPAASPPG